MKKLRTLTPYLVLFVVLVGMALNVTYARYRMPSGSMMPTLQIGDFIIVDRSSYGIPIPFTELEYTATSDPQAGEVIVFRYPEDPSISYIKRVIGIPGDRISICNKEVYVNGEKKFQKEIGVYMGDGFGLMMNGSIQKTETINQREHSILINNHRPASTEFCHEGGNEIHVPDGQYFVMGDNRDNSRDSRYWGFVPRDNVIGKAKFIWMNWDSQRKESYIDYNRIGKPVT